MVNFYSFFACEVSASVKKLESRLVDVTLMFLNFKIDLSIS